MLGGIYMNSKLIRKGKINKKKVVATISIILLLTISIIFLLGNNDTLSHSEIAYKTIYVSNGETLWEIARIEAQNNEYYSNYDIRYIVKDIKIINGLENSSIYVGQKLQIPII